MNEKKKLIIIVFMLIFGLSIGMIFGYYTSPFGISECFRKLGYQNVTCVQNGSDYHCLLENGTGYRIEKWQYNK